MIQSPKIDTGDTSTPQGEAQVTGRSQGNGRRVQRTVNFDRDILDRARAAATHLARNEPSAGVRSLADIVNPAVAARVAELEGRFNQGAPFQPVNRMPAGRPADSPGALVSATPAAGGGSKVAGAAEVTLVAPAHPDEP